MRIRPSAVFAAALSAGLPGFSAAQPVIDITGMSACTTCVLRPTLVAQFGTADGEGIIEGDGSEVRYNPITRRYAVFQIGGTRILFFDSTGKFIRSVGRKGEGPTEISHLVDAHFSGNNIIALNRTGPRFMVIDTTGKVLHESRQLMVRRGRFVVVSDSELVLGSMDRSRELAGHPLHRVRVQTGEAVGHFGRRDSQWSVLDPWSQSVLLGVSPSRMTVWRGQPAPFQVEEWRLDGSLLRTVKDDGKWFPPGTVSGPDGPPAALMAAFGVDANERLWTITRVPDPEWRDVKRGATEGFVLSGQLQDYFDTRIDIFDLRAKKHLGSLVWDDVFVGLVEVNGRLAVQRAVDSTGIPRVALYYVEFGPSR